jgi:glycosyltransferase XagB
VPRLTARLRRRMAGAGRRTVAELLRFCVIGGLGLVVNLCVFAICIWALQLAPMVAAICAFCVAVFHNYALNRRWTFPGGAGVSAGQGARFLVISVGGLALNLIFLNALTGAAVPELLAQTIAIVLVTPTTFALNKFWTFHHRSTVALLPPRDQSPSTTPRSVCVCVPTYNEADNVRPFVYTLLDQFDGHEIDGAVLIIDDASPDGTGALADELAENDRRVHVLHRPEKRGLGSAYQAGFRWAIERDFDVIAQMDCDFSHDPHALPQLLDASRGSDVVIGSRYVPGGRVENWPLSRRIISRCGSFYARALLRVPVRDFTGGFKCFRRQVLENVPFESAEARGYGFQIELTYRAVQSGFRVVEVPIVFRDRVAGESKMSASIAREAALLVLRLRSSRDFQLPASSPGRPRRTYVEAIRDSTARLVLHARDGTIRLRYLRYAAAIAAGAAVTLATVQHPEVITHAALVAVYAILFVIGATTVAWMLYAWRDEDAPAETRFPPTRDEPQLSFSLILPARHEQDVLCKTLTELRRQDHPMFEVVVVVGHDDPGTRSVAEAAIAGDERFSIVVDVNEAKNKPKALNTGLRECDGDIIGVFDAEDIVAPTLLRSVEQLFRDTGAEVVQGATQLMNVRSSWFAVRNVLEYYFWFKSRLHFHARAGFIPLGGNTVFVRREWLDAIRGWDENCLAEDCDLGGRLSTMGAATAVAYTPELVTREEAPETLAAFVRQRTRWNQGYLQVLRKRDWQTLPVKPRLLAAYTLVFPFLQAMMAVIFPIAIVTMLLLPVPILLALMSFLPAMTVLVVLAIELVGLREFGLEFGVRTRMRDYVRLIVGVIPYQFVLAYAAMRAVWREAHGVRNWEKTAHVGAHLSDA